jgi:predicted polyphosphate/ATP-dependent NAD kinase
VATTLVGVDVVDTTGLRIADATESDLAEVVARGPATVIVTPIGGQGFLFGRGNPQIGPRVLTRIDRADILVLATPSKLARLEGRPFLVDSGDPAVDAALAGFVEVVTGYHERTLYRVSS